MTLDTFKTGSGFEVNYHFNVAAGADLNALSGLDAVIERPELWDLFLNGTNSQNRTNGGSTVNSTVSR